LGRDYDAFECVKRLPGEGFISGRCSLTFIHSFNHARTHPLTY